MQNCCCILVTSIVMSTGFIIFLLLSPVASMRPVAQRTVECSADGTDTYLDVCGKRFEGPPPAYQATLASLMCTDKQCLCAEGGRWLDVNDKFAVTQKCGKDKAKVVTFKACKPGCAMVNPDQMAKLPNGEVPRGWPQGYLNRYTFQIPA